MSLKLATSVFSTSSILVLVLNLYFRFSADSTVVVYLQKTSETDKNHCVILNTASPAYNLVFSTGRYSIDKSACYTWGAVTSLIISTIVAMMTCCGKRKHCHFVMFYITS